MIGEATQPVTKAFQALGFDKLYLLFSPKYQQSVDSVRDYLTPFSVAVETE